MITSERRTAREIARRALADRVLGRAAWVDDGDRVLLEQVLGCGVRPKDVGVGMGWSSRRVRLRVGALTRRLTHPEVVYILRNHTKWEQVTGSVAVGFWVRNWSIKQIAAHLKVSEHEVRRQVEMVRGILYAGVKKHVGG